MSQPGPIILATDDETQAFARRVISGMFPLIKTSCADAYEAVSRVKPSGVIISSPCDVQDLQRICRAAGSLTPYTPVIAVNPTAELPPNALPLTGSSEQPHRLHSRLNAALRVRTLHATVLRRMQSARLSGLELPKADPLSHATVLLVGRGSSFPSLSVSFGERVGLVGALSIEAAAKHLNARPFDGIVLADGFTPRVVDAFLQVLSEDSRFRNLPIIVTACSVDPNKYDLPNLERPPDSVDAIVSHALPLIRQSAYEGSLDRALQSIDAEGLRDIATGLLTAEAFFRDLGSAIAEVQKDSSGLAIALFTLATPSDRSRIDAARIMGSLIRRMDFATLQDDGTIIVAFPGTGMRDARIIVRRISSVLRQTAVSDKPNGKLANDVTVTSVARGDNVSAILSRLRLQEQRNAS